MSTSKFEKRCSLCPEENTYLCKGCSQIFCFEHLKHHRDIINQEFNQTEDNFNSLIENLNDQINNPNQRLFMTKINQWKQDSIQKIEQIAKECEENLIKYTSERFLSLKTYLNEVLKQNQVKDKSNEDQLNQLKNKLNKLNEQFEELLKISFKQKSASFIDQIYFNQSKFHLF